MKKSYLWNSKKSFIFFPQKPLFKTVQLNQNKHYDKNSLH